MGQQKKTAKGRLDKYYYMAKEQGYRARSAFKLVQLNKKFDFLSQSRCVLDLCAAPGGWLQVAAKYCPTSSIIIGVDRVPIKPIRNVIGLTEDITTEKCRQNIKKELKGWQVDAVLHDGAPNVGTAWVQDAFSQVELALKSLQLATEFLKPGGWFVSKVFRSGDYFAFMWVLNQLFEKVHATKPPSSRNVSAEIFVVCKGYKAPDKMDPRLLDPKYVFENVENKKKVDLFSAKTKKAQAAGYDDNITQHTKKCASQFVHCEDPMLFLVQTSQIAFDDQQEDDVRFKKHVATTQEVHLCMEDLKVLGKKDLKLLLKWRTQMRKVWRDEHPDAPVPGQTVDITEDADDADAADDDGVEMTTEEAETLEIEDMIAEAKESEKRDTKAKRRKTHRLEAKQKERLALHMDLPGDTFDTQEDATLFGIKTLKNAKNLEQVGNNVTLPDILGDSEDDWSDDSEASDSYTDNSDYDSEDEEEAKYKRKREAELEEMFLDHRARHLPGGRASAKLDARAARKEKRNGKEEEVVLGEEMNTEQIVTEVQARNPLLVDMDDRSSDMKTEMWFQQDAFADILNEGDDEEAEISALATVAEKTRKRKQDAENVNEPAAEAGTATAAQNKKQKLAREANGGDFEAVAEEEYVTDSESDYDDSEDENVDGEPTYTGGVAPKDSRALNAEGLALGTLLLNKKSRNELIDDSYNRYNRGEEHLPNWFMDHEKKFQTGPQQPIPKDMLAYYKDRLKEVNARPIKKVAEARARKKMKSEKKTDAIKRKMEGVANSDMGAVQKGKELEKLLRKADKKSGRRDAPQIIVANKTTGKGRPTGVKGRYKVLDKRMKSDLRGEKKAADRKAGKKPKKKRY
ncbi:hypothetical protein SARC_07454 [Sphaeroforma arctica JP610]|uniref:Putative rRNA methyltransferase n=1 Tax=Sphaeroforma arctica JP610 TaxID=667725 RepID=A0A0L0FTN4_9EUKA|nr:hypothetical protein SARC_07454 [Sphaeroforma arctica JP610]KNC80175.1 hypothetical protein SARC_07454 [Sphaeroforma arctica JP610]|eukprot:XP_014154077.1 hypothetical protein SARC_07454 [Sphaeroforma arctica JP610]